MTKKVEIEMGVGGGGGKPYVQFLATKLFLIKFVSFVESS
jgi:hypothetical protein